MEYRDPLESFENRAAGCCLKLVKHIYDYILVSVPIHRPRFQPIRRQSLPASFSPVPFSFAHFPSSILSSIPHSPFGSFYCPYCSKCLWIHYRKQMDTGTTSFSYWQSQTGNLLWGLSHSISSCLCQSSVLRDSISTCPAPSLSLKNVHMYAHVYYGS